MVKEPKAAKTPKKNPGVQKFFSDVVFRPSPQPRAQYDTVCFLCGEEMHRGDPVRFYPRQQNQYGRPTRRELQLPAHPLCVEKAKVLP